MLDRFCSGSPLLTFVSYGNDVRTKNSLKKGLLHFIQLVS